MKSVNILTAAMLVVAGAIIGCGDNNKTGGKKDKAGAKDAGKSAPHAHGKGPNGGVVFDIGKHHAEFTVDHDKKECTILILGDDEKTPKPVATKDLTVTTKESKTKEGKVVPAMTIKMLAKDESGGKATKYVGTDPGLGSVADFEGTVTGEVDGKPSQGEFKE